MNRSSTGNSQAMHRNHGWGTGIVEWVDGKTTNISVVFSWLLEKAIARAAELLGQGNTVHLGGTAIDSAGLGNGRCDASFYHNPNATRTSTGCVFACPFCIVPKIEGDFMEKDQWEPRPIIYDNNLTACSVHHFDKVIDSLKSVVDVDFNQGVSASLLTPHHASRFAELNLKYVRLAWDNTNYESRFMRGFEILRAAGIPRSKISAYVLIGFNDTPDDALYRLESVRKLGIKPFPMRYQPIDTKKRNSFVGDNWTNNELERFTHYWTNLRFVGNLPFKDFVYPIPKELRRKTRGQTK